MMSASEEIHKLVERFDRNLDTYRSGKYNEVRVRQEFINPFFKTLGQYQGRYRSGLPALPTCLVGKITTQHSDGF